MAEGDNGVYHRGRCVLFRKTHEGYGGLSNMASGYPLLVNGVRIRTAEALYQACRFPHLREAQEAIIAQASPMLAKMQSRHYHAQSRRDWEQIKVRVMRWCLRVKLAQSWPTFRDLLIRTGEDPIVEESSKDDFWGAIPQDEDLLVGNNMLGRLLTELRDDLEKPTASGLLYVAPVPIANFLLYGEPIGPVEAWHVPAEPLTDPDLCPDEAALWRLPEAL